MSMLYHVLDEFFEMFRFCWMKIFEICMESFENFVLKIKKFERNYCVLAKFCNLNIVLFFRKLKLSS